MPANFDQAIPVILDQNPPKTESWIYQVTIRRITRKGEGTTYEIAVVNPPSYSGDELVNELVLKSLNETFVKHSS